MCGKMELSFFRSLQIAIVILVLASTVLCENDPCKSDPDKASTARVICNIILGGSRFSDCRRVTPPSEINKTLEACIKDLCRCDSLTDTGCVCPPFAKIAKECTRLGACPDWRDDANCPMTCPDTRVYKACSSSCKDTCYVKGKDINDKCDTQIIAEGCFCQDGLIEDAKGNCIEQKDCPCEYSGQTYPSKTTITINRQSCVCDSGKFTCTGGPCPVKCKSDEFLCGDKSKCISKDLVCDKTDNCRDQSDEKNCPVSCAVTPCQNDGRCSDGACVCSFRWMGNQCEIPVPLCPTKLCQNEGTCYIGKTGCSFICDCKGGFTGDTCSTPG